jgi:hypothetical protein
MMPGATVTLGGHLAQLGQLGGMSFLQQAGALPIGSAAPLAVAPAPSVPSHSRLLTAPPPGSQMM